MLVFALATALVFERGPVVSDVTSDAAEIRWEPAIAGATLVVGTGATAITVPASTTEDGVQRARVEGLASDRIHRYEVRAPAGSSVAGAFRTFPATARSPISFIAIGDTRSDHATHARLVARVSAETPDFIVSTGDLVGDGRVTADWDAFFRVEGELLRMTPFFPAIGNHDARGLLNETQLGRWFGRSRYYEVVAGPAVFLFVDTTLAYADGSAQGAWLRGRLAAARAAKEAGERSWIVALHHHPAFSSARHGSDPSIQRELVPLYEAAGVDLVLNGHDHVYERLERAGVTYVVTGGGGAPLYEFQQALPESRVRAESYHYLRVTADTDRLAISAVDLDGNILDTHDLKAGAPRETPAQGIESALAFPLVAIAAAAAIAWTVSARLV